MRKLLNRFVTLFILIFMVTQLFTVAFASLTIPAATSDFYVNDFAGVFSEEEKTQLMSNAVALSDEHDGIQLVITTVESLGGYTVEEYATEMYNQYEIGKDDMGLLILLSTGDRQIRVEVGKAMEAYVNDSKAGRFIDKYAIPALKENNFSEGLISLQGAFIDEIIANVSEEKEIPTDFTAPSTNTQSGSGFLSVIGTLLMICVVAGVVILIVMLVRKVIAFSHRKQQKIDELTAQLESSKREIARVTSRAHEEVAQASFRASQEATELKKKIQLLSEEKSSLETQYDTLSGKYGTLSDRYQRVQQLYPSADSDVTAMIDEEIRQRDMALAKQVDDVIQSVIGLPASKDIVHKLDTAKSRYANLTQKQKSYIESDIGKLNHLYDESLRLKRQYEKEMEEARRKKAALAAVASITAIISCISIGKAKDLRKLKEAKSIYDALDAGSRPYFDTSVADQLNRLYRQAKRDQEEEEARERQRQEEERREEERRRRQREEEERSSSSSFGGDFHYGGFGGHSGGGGASRGF